MKPDKVQHKIIFLSKHTLYIYIYIYILWYLTVFSNINQPMWWLSHIHRLLHILTSTDFRMLFLASMLITKLIGKTFIYMITGQLTKHTQTAVCLFNNCTETKHIEARINVSFCDNHFQIFFVKISLKFKKGPINKSPNV